MHLVKDSLGFKEAVKICAQIQPFYVFFLSDQKGLEMVVPFLSFLDICFFSLLDSGLLGKILLGFFCLWLVLDSLCDALSVQWQPEYP